MATTRELSLDVIDSRDQDRLDRLRSLLNVARDIECVGAVDGLESHYYEAAQALRESRPFPSMAPVKRELVRVRERVALALRLAGASQHRIAKQMGLSQPAVCKILRRVDRRTLDRMDAQVERVKIRQAAQLEYILDQATDAWRSSMESIETRATNVVAPGPDCGENRLTRTTSNRRGPGDPRFLMVALSALAAERALWGVGRPPAPSQEVATIEATRTESVTVTATRRTP